MVVFYFVVIGIDGIEFFDLLLLLGLLLLDLRLLLDGFLLMGLGGGGVVIILKLSLLFLLIRIVIVLLCLRLLNRIWLVNGFLMFFWIICVNGCVLYFLLYFFFVNYLLVLGVKLNVMLWLFSCVFNWRINFLIICVIIFGGKFLNEMIVLRWLWNFGENILLIVFWLFFLCLLCLNLIGVFVRFVVLVFVVMIMIILWKLIFLLLWFVSVLWFIICKRMLKRFGCVFLILLSSKILCGFWLIVLVSNLFWLKFI